MGSHYNGPQAHYNPVQKGPWALVCGPLGPLAQYLLGALGPLYYKILGPLGPSIIAPWALGPRCIMHWGPQAPGLYIVTLGPQAQ